MPITILDYVRFEVGEEDSYTAEDFSAAGVAMLGGCENCSAALAAYNAYPSTSGSWRCADCIGDTGFATVEEFIQADNGTRRHGPGDADATLVNCPECGGVEHLREIAEHLFLCGDCGSTWSL